MRNILLFALLCTLSSKADVRYVIGTDLFQMQYKEQRYKFDDYGTFKDPINNISRLSIGINYQPFKNKYLYTGLRTTRLINAPTSTKAFDTYIKQEVNVDTKLISDSFFIATAVHKRIVPYITITRIETKTEIMYQGGIKIQKNNHTTLYGTGFAVPFCQNHSISFTYFLPDKKYNSKRAFGLSYNYIIPND
jgi:hypothetical protein